MNDLITEKKGQAVGVRVSKRRRVWTWIFASLLIVVVVLGVVGEIAVHRAVPIMKGRVIETLSTRFNSRVELDGFEVSLVKGFGFRETA